MDTFKNASPGSTTTGLRRLLKIAEVCEVLNLSRGTVDKLVRKGLIPVIRFAEVVERTAPRHGVPVKVRSSGAVRVAYEDLCEFVNKSKKGGSCDTH